MEVQRRALGSYVCGMVWTHSYIIGLIVWSEMVVETLMIFNQLMWLMA
jgi:hypothetical protein